MKNKNIYRSLIILFVTIVALCAIPVILKIATTTSNPNYFVYYSSVLQDFTIKEMMGKQVKMTDKRGNTYVEKQFDSITPLFSYRQLMVNNAMPDTINGRAIDIKENRMKSFIFKYAPKEIHTPDMGLYIMYESLSGKVKLESPGDVFRLKDKIEFIDLETNKVNAEKSERFQKALVKEGYTFPTQWSAGNMNIRKPYDEGYFSLDADGKLFHIKMVNSRPYVRNTKIGEQIECKYFSMLEVSDRRFYGFLFDTKGAMYIVELQGNKYVPVRLDIAPIDMDNDDVMIMANMMYWTIYVRTSAMRQYYALDAENLSRVDDLSIAIPQSRWDKVSAWVMPYYLTFEEKNNSYIQPYVHFTAYTAFILNAVLALLMFFLIRSSSVKEKLLSSLFVVFTGIAGAIAILLIPTFNNKNK